MGRILKPYPDIGGAVLLAVEGWFPDELAPLADRFRTGRVLPQNVQDHIAAGEFFCRVTDIGGNDDGLTDHPLIDVDILGPTYALTRDLAFNIQARLLGYPWRAGSTVIDKVRTAMRPHPVPWGDERIHRFYGSYTVSARR